MLNVLLAANGAVPLTMSVPGESPGAIIPALLNAAAKLNVPLPLIVPALFRLTVEEKIPAPLFFLI